VRAVLFSLAGALFGLTLGQVARTTRRPGSDEEVVGAPLTRSDPIGWLAMGSVAVALAFLATAIGVHPLWKAWFVAPFVGVTVMAGLIDARYRIIPNRLMYPTIVAYASGLAVVTAVGKDPDLAAALLGAVGYGGGLLLVAIVAPKGMGMGDVKLGFLSGLAMGALGARYVLVAAAAAVVFGGVGGVVALASGRGPKAKIPFGPFMAAGSLLAILLAPQVSHWYLSGRL